MLRENPQQRPNIHQVLSEACAMQGIAVPIKDVRAHNGPKWSSSADCHRYTLVVRSPPPEGISSFQPPIRARHHLR